MAARARAADRGMGLIARDIFYKGKILIDPNLSAALSKHAELSAAQVALHFAVQENPENPVLVGLSSQAHLRELVNGLAVPPLSFDDIKELRELGFKFATQD